MWQKGWYDDCGSGGCALLPSAPGCGGSGGHFTPEEVWESTRDELPGLELSTVYRVLDALRKAGLVVENRLPEGSRVFEAGASFHPHLVCERCGEVTHPGPEAGERLSRLAGQDLGDFQARGVYVVVVGLCARCAEG